MSDADLINEQWNNIINRFREDNNKWENHTRKQYILECAIIVERKIDNKLLDIEKQEICSYLTKEFIKEEFTIDDSTIRYALPPIYKRNYSESRLNRELNKPIWKTIADNDHVLVEEDQHGHHRINGIEVREIKEPVGVTQDFDSSEEDKIPEIIDDYTKLLHTMAECGNCVVRFGNALKDAYNKSPKAREVIQNNIPDIKAQQQEYLKIHATLNLSRNDLDKREKWGDYEKTQFKFLLKVCDTMAHLGEKVGYCSKYASIGIDRNDELDRYEQFAKTCPMCHEDISHFKNLQYQLYKSGMELGIELPVSSY